MNMTINIAETALGDFFARAEVKNESSLFFVENTYVAQTTIEAIAEDLKYQMGRVITNSLVIKIGCGKNG